jgi:hypothetical protein
MPFVHRLSRAAPNSALQRTVHDKVLARGRVWAAPLRAPRARVLMRRGPPLSLVVRRH